MLTMRLRGDALVPSWLDWFGLEELIIYLVIGLFLAVIRTHFFRIKWKKECLELNTAFIVWMALPVVIMWPILLLFGTCWVLAQAGMILDDPRTYKKWPSWIGWLIPPLMKLGFVLCIFNLPTSFGESVFEELPIETAIARRWVVQR